MADALSRHVTHGQTPQMEKARADQVKNNAGGYTFQVSDTTRLNRFLTLGTDGGTYYVAERPLTRENAAFVTGLAEQNAPFLVNDTARISEAGRAPRNNPALFALAAAAGLGDTRYRQGALDVMPRVARTGTHFLTFVKYAEMFRGWGPQFTKGVANWFTSKTADDLAYQLLKYKQRDGWAMRDVMRLANSKGGLKSLATPEHRALFEYVMKGTFDADNLPALVDVAEQAHETRAVKDWVRLIASNRSLSHEMLPSEALAEADVWRAMIEHGTLPLTALLRNLARLTKLGVLAPMSVPTAVIEKLTNQDYITKSRIHPVNVLIAQRTYAAGYSRRGSSTWVPVPQVTDALDDMFYKAFGNVEPSGKSTLISLDVSGSMGSPAGDTGLSCREVTAAMSMVVAKTEPNYAIMGFSNTFVPLNISPRQRLDDVIRTINGLPFAGTDCSLPMLWAQQNNIAVDTFQVWTDNETWAGRMHPHEALKQYRRASGRDARMQVIGISATNFSIADPLDPGQLDVSGFDSAVPQLLAAHARGEV